MKSQVKILAEQKGIKNPQALSYKAQITWPTAKNAWTGDLSKVHAETMLKLMLALNCQFEDLFVFEPN